MSWKTETVKDYFEVNKAQVSYTHFLNQVEEKILEHLESAEDLAILDGQLFGLYKASIPHGAPPSAFKRLNNGKFWNKIQAKVKKNLNEDNLYENFQNSAFMFIAIKHNIYQGPSSICI
ncbi:hypothetical protein MBANPS3_001188 [Mucor bainieri]